MPRRRNAREQDAIAGSRPAALWYRAGVRAAPLALAVLLLVTPVARVTAADGHLVLVGGGPTPADVFARALAYSGGRAAIVAILPQTFPTDTIADAAVAMWRAFGVHEVVKVSRTDAVEARAALERASLIWMPGGFQGLLLRDIRGTAIPAIVRARFAAGVTIGGASAGAAAMSQTMVADESGPAGVGVDGPRTDEGLGLWPEAIVSPHFTERRRLHPLKAILADHPALFGVGLDEGTAVVVFQGTLDVLGRGTVTILDAGRSRPRTFAAGARVRYRDLVPSAIAAPERP